MTTEPVRRSRRAWEIQALIASKRMKASGAKTLQEFSEKDYPHFCKLVEAYSALGTVFSKEVLDKAGIVVVEAEDK
jgi:hypothetical protein